MKIIVFSLIFGLFNCFKSQNEPDFYEKSNENIHRSAAIMDIDENGEEMCRSGEMKPTRPSGKEFQALEGIFK